MNEEEKQAYNYLEKYIKWETLGERNLEGDIKTILDLIKKQQKEIEGRLEEIDSLYKMMSVKDDEIKYLEQKLEQYGLDYQILKEKIEELEKCERK
jgi:peptidoglycan hydrolase CwlO-like protein